MEVSKNEQDIKQDISNNKSDEIGSILLLPKRREIPRRIPRQRDIELNRDDKTKSIVNYNDIVDYNETINYLIDYCRFDTIAANFNEYRNINKEVMIKLLKCWFFSLINEKIEENNVDEVTKKSFNEAFDSLRIKDSSYLELMKENYKISADDILKSQLRQIWKPIIFNHQHEWITEDLIRKFVLFDQLNFNDEWFATIVLETNEVHDCNCVKLTPELSKRTYWAHRWKRKWVSHMIDEQDYPYNHKTSTLVVILKESLRYDRPFDIEDTDDDNITPLWYNNTRSCFKVVTAFRWDWWWHKEPWEMQKFWRNNGYWVSDSINYWMNHALIPEANEDIHKMEKPYRAKLYDKILSKYNLNLQNWDEIKIISEDDVNFEINCEKAFAYYTSDYHLNIDNSSAYKYCIFIKKNWKWGAIKADNWDNTLGEYIDSYKLDSKIHLIHKFKYDQILYYDRRFNMIVKVWDKLRIISCKWEEVDLEWNTIVEEWINSDEIDLEWLNNNYIEPDYVTVVDYEDENYNNDKLYEDSDVIGYTEKKLFELVNWEKHEIENFWGIWHKF